MAAKIERVDEKVLHSFAKRLANNEPKLRKLALKKLKGWMEVRSGNVKFQLFCSCVISLQFFGYLAL